MFDFFSLLLNIRQMIYTYIVIMRRTAFSKIMNFMAHKSEVLVLGQVSNVYIG